MEYISVLSSDNVLDNAVENEYIFYIDYLHTINELDGREVRMEIFFYLKVILLFNDIIVYIWIESESD